MREPITTLGTILTQEEQRDAIHIAIAPVVAAQNLLPGQHIGLLESGSASSVVSQLLGIVDPFLKSMVKPGERFWMFLYPNTIRGLRHHWTHPAFDGQAEKEDGITQKAGTISKPDHVAYSKEWIKEHAEDLGLSYDAIIRDADDWLVNREYHVQRDRTQWRDLFNATEFWHHYEVVTGKVVSAAAKENMYCCSC